MDAYEKLVSAQKSNATILCVGLDTELSRIPAKLRNEKDGMLEFNRAIIDATKDIVCAYKLNFAFYEQYGIPGFETLKKTIDHIPDDILVIADAKRGDIGNTSAAYARACFEYFRVDSVTVNPYMGYDSVEPFLKFPGKLVFLLILTSNPGSQDFQRLVSEGKPLYRHVFEKSGQWGDSKKLGYVVGATHPEELAELRNAAVRNIFLIPGIGVQGGNIEATLKANRGAPAIINISRAVIYASQRDDFAEKAREKAVFYGNALNP